MEKKLQRNQQDKMIAGVCSGLSDYFDIDVTWVRIAFVVAVMAGASGILAYIILWIAVPQKPYFLDFTQYNAGDSVNGMSGTNSSQAFINPNKKDRGNLRLIAGVIFISFGLFFLLNEFELIPDWMDVENLWPLILIAMGIYIISAGINKKQVAAVEPEANKVEDTEEIVPTNASEENNEKINPSADNSTEKPL